MVNKLIFWLTVAALAIFAVFGCPFVHDYNRDPNEFLYWGSSIACGISLAALICVGVNKLAESL